MLIDGSGCGGNGVRWRRNLAVIGLLVVVHFGANAQGNEAGWGELVQMPGHQQPIPRVWLTDDEARFAHSLKLPDSIPKHVAFDFKRARWRALLPWNPSVTEQYFEHLCATEAGEWILKTDENVEGIYFARPRAHSFARAPIGRYAVEAPHLESNLARRAEDSLSQSGSEFVAPPYVSYVYVEEPRRDVAWQAHITTPYVRIFGQRYAPVRLFPDSINPTMTKVADMQLIGIDQPTARYGYTWRGIVRPRDREFSVAGSEAIIFDRHTLEIMAVRRTFTRGPEFSTREGQRSVSWLHGGQCNKTRSTGSGWEPINRLAVITLKTKGKSSVLYAN